MASHYSIIILLLSFCLIFYSIGCLSGMKIIKTESVLRSVLIFSAILVFITEFLSAFNLLTFQYILSSWCGISLLCLAYLYKNKSKIRDFNNNLKNSLENSISKPGRSEKYLLISVIVLLVLIFIQGIIYPPNNWDSMTYHLARIPHWISNQSLTPYPTHITRQLYQPPFAEFVILHFNSLNCGDYFSNIVQLLFLIFSIFAIVSIVGLLGLGYKYKLLAVILTVCIPEVVLQASSTQNDIVTGFFILSSVYFGTKAYREHNFVHYLFFGLSIGLAVLTKGTAYLFLAPVIGFFIVAILIKILRTRNLSFLAYTLISGLVFIGLNSGQYLRNYRLNRNFLGISDVESRMYSNEKMSPELLFLSVIKNAGLHLNPTPINKISEKLIYKLHAFLGVDINNSATNINNIKYSAAGGIPNNEDTASNSIQFFLLILTVIIITINFIKKRAINNRIMIYGFVMIIQIVIFCYYLKWQPWHTRLHTPVFLFSIPLICFAISLNEKYFKLMLRFAPLLLFSAFFIVIINYLRPYFQNRFTSGISITDNRYKKYFAARPDLFEEYKTSTENFKKFNNKNIGLIIGEDDWEYPLFRNVYSEELNPIHIKVSNYSKDIPPGQKMIDCIISTTINDTAIDYKGTRFYNQVRMNKVIWLYETKAN